MVSFTNPEFIYIFTADIGGHIRIQREVSDNLESFKLLQLRKDTSSTGGDGESSNKIIDEMFFKKTIIGKWIVDVDFLRELEGAIKLDGITFWRPQEFYKEIPFYDPPFGSVEIKLFKVGVVSILLRFKIGDGEDEVEKSADEVLELVNFPDSPTKGKLNRTAHEIARDIFHHFKEDFEKEYSGAIQISSLVLEGKKDHGNKFSDNWVDANCYVGTIVPNLSGEHRSQNKESPKILNAYIALAKTTPAYLNGFSKDPAKDYIDDNDILSTEKEHILIEDRSWLASGSRLMEEPLDYRARIFENIIFCLETTFAATKVMGRFVDNLDKVEGEMGERLDIAVSNFLSTKALNDLIGCTNAFASHYNQTRRLSRLPPFRDEICNLSVRISSDTLKKALTKAQSFRLKGTSGVAKDKISDLNQFLQSDFNFISGFTQGTTLEALLNSSRSINTLTIAVVVMNLILLGLFLFFAL